MTKVGLGLPGQSIADIQGAAEAAAPYDFDSFSVYGDLGDLPPYAVLHAAANNLRGSEIHYVGPMGVPAGMVHPEVIGMHALALDEQLPGQSYVGLVRGAFLETIGEQPASLFELESVLESIQEKFKENGAKIPIYLGGFGQKILNLAGRLQVDGVKLGGSTNPRLAEKAKKLIRFPDTKLVLGAVSVIDPNRNTARALARQEVGKYLNVVGHLDTTLDQDELESLDQFVERFENKDPQASDSISDSLLNKFALAGTPEDALEVLESMRGSVDRFEFGTPHGIGSRSDAIHLIGQSIIKEIGE